MAVPPSATVPLALTLLSASAPSAAAVSRPARAPKRAPKRPKLEVWKGPRGPQCPRFYKKVGLGLESIDHNRDARTLIRSNGRLLGNIRFHNFPRGCLTIQWKRKEVGDRWNGAFAWRSILFGDKTALVTLNTASPSDVPGKLRFSGHQHIFRANKSGNWSIQMEKRLDEVLVGADELDQHLPNLDSEVFQPHIKAKLSGNHWGFLSGSDDLSSMCTGGSGCEARDLSKVRAKKWHLELKHNGDLLVFAPKTRR